MISNLNVKHTYDANGSITEWPYTFPINNADEIEIWITNSDGVISQITTNYEVDMINDVVVYPTPASGLSPVALGNKITVNRILPLVQETDWTTNGSFKAETLESGEDKIVMILQQLDEKISRCPKYNIDETVTDDDTDTWMSAINAIKAECQALYDSILTFVPTVDTWDNLKAKALANPAETFECFDTDNGLRLFYCADPTKGEDGFIVLGGTGGGSDDTMITGDIG